MMLIYPKQHELDITDSQASMGLAPQTSTNIMLKGSSCICYEAKAEHIEEMSREERSYSAVAMSSLPHTLRIWKYDDFNLEQIGEGFFGNVYKVGLYLLQYCGIQS